MDKKTLPEGFALDADGHGINALGWRICSQKRPISASDNVDKFFDDTKVKCPEMVYLENFMQIENKAYGFDLRFLTADALKGCLYDTSDSKAMRDDEATAKAVQSASDAVRVSMAKMWEGRTGTDIEELPQEFDWTYTTSYTGTLGPLEMKETEEGLDMDLLKRPDPIFWFDDVLLFEDELHDNGVSHMAAKMRVMPTFWLCLLRFWLRVDGVLLRVIDVRFFHKFGTDYVYRELQRREATFEQLKQARLPVDPKFYADPNRFATRLPLTATGKHRIMLKKSE